MRLLALHLILLLSLASAACAQTRPIAAANHPQTSQRLNSAAAGYIGFDSNDYPGDEALPALRRMRGAGGPVVVGRATEGDGQSTCDGARRK